PPRHEVHKARHVRHWTRAGTLVSASRAGHGVAAYQALVGGAAWAACLMYWSAEGPSYQRISLKRHDLQLTEPKALPITQLWRTLPADGGAFLLGLNHQSIHLLT